MITNKSYSRLCAIVGGSLGCIVVLFIAAGQLNLAEVIRGRIPLDVAISMGKDAIGFLGFLMLINLFALITGRFIYRSQRLRVAIIWTGLGLIMVYPIYVSRFSIGMLMIPSAALLLLAGSLAFYENMG